MQSQRREVRADNNEYEREHQSLAKQIKRVVILRNGHILAFCVVRIHTHIFKLFQCSTHALLSFSTFHTSMHMHD